MNWNNRGDRIGRMKERDQFGKYFMPLAYLIALAGLLIMAWQGINKMEMGHWSRDVFVVANCWRSCLCPAGCFGFAEGIIARG